MLKNPPVIISGGTGMTKYYLAVDIGASSGRHILGHLENDSICLEEIYRFPNYMDTIDGSLVWDTRRIFREILAGMRRCAEIGKIPESMSIDTWGVDFVLLDRDKKMLGPAVSYRDNRTCKMDLEMDKLVPADELYARTGIPTYVYNTSCQLLALKKKSPELLTKAQALLMTPDYYQFLLTGEMAQEYTMATTTQLVNVHTGLWDEELIRRFGLPTHIFCPIRHPGTFLGNLMPEISESVGFNCKVVLCASHDTASAVMTIPGDETFFISSGTWSIAGMKTNKAVVSEEGRAGLFTNEGGSDKGYYFARNIMGLWMIQSVRKEYGGDLSYDRIAELAAKETISSLVDCMDSSFLAPESMKEAVRDACRRTNQEIPEGLPQIAWVIYNSLARCYSDTISSIESLTGRRKDDLYIAGGGAASALLCDLTAKYSHKRICPASVEATAEGNILIQLRHERLL